RGGHRRPVPPARATGIIAGGRLMRLLYMSGDPGVPVLGHKGASVHLRELATALNDLGVEVAIASPRTEPAGDSLDAPVALLSIPRVAPDASELDLRTALGAQRAAVLEH